MLSLVVSLVLARLDYGSATLAGLPAHLTDRLQSVMNAAVRLIFSSRKYDHVTPLLHELHWLRMRQRIEYKLAVLVYHCLHGLAPPYLASDLQRVTILSVATLRRREGGATLLTSGSQSCVGCRQPEIRCTEL